MSHLKTFTAAEIAEKFADLGSLTEPVDMSAREAELSKLTKGELVAHIISLETPRAPRGTTVQDVAKAILQDPEMVAVPYDTVAEACRILVPNAMTSSKSIASYVSKKRVEWNLPDRIMVRVMKPKEPSAEPLAEPTAEQSAEPLA